MENENSTILTFQLGSEYFGVDVASVVEVVKNEHITNVPKSESFIKGIINFRGDILTVIDFAEKLSLPENMQTSGNVVIVFKFNYNDTVMSVGILADAVSSVSQIESNDIKPVKEISYYYNPEFLKGVVKLNEHFVILLDIVKIFTEKEVQLITNNIENNKNK